MDNTVRFVRFQNGAIVERMDVIIYDDVDCRSQEDAGLERKREVELKRRLSLARASRNKTEIRRIEKQLKFWGIPV